MISKLLKLLQPKPLLDDYHLKCASCGHESVGEEGILYVRYSDWTVEGRCCICHGNAIYYKKDWLDIKAQPIKLKVKKGIR